MALIECHLEGEQKAVQIVNRNENQCRPGLCIASISLEHVAQYTADSRKVVLKKHKSVGDIAVCIRAFRSMALKNRELRSSKGKLLHYPYYIIFGILAYAFTFL